MSSYPAQRVTGKAWLMVNMVQHAFHVPPITPALVNIKNVTNQSEDFLNPFMDNSTSMTNDCKRELQNDTASVYM